MFLFIKTNIFFIFFYKPSSMKLTALWIKYTVIAIVVILLLLLLLYCYCYCCYTVIAIVVILLLILLLYCYCYCCYIVIDIVVMNYVTDPAPVFRSNLKSQLFQSAYNSWFYSLLPLNLLWFLCILWLLVLCAEPGCGCVYVCVRACMHVCVTNKFASV